MRSAHCAIAIFLVPLLYICNTAGAQDSLSNKAKFLQLFSSASLFQTTLQGDSLSKYNLDSLARKKLVDVIQLPDTSFLFQQVPEFKKNYLTSTLSAKPLVKVNGGYISYNWLYRSGTDTPFVENNISQHLLSASVNLTIANSIPISIAYFGRQSNSTVFRDFRDVRVDFNVSQFQQMQTDRFRAYLASMGDKLRNPIAKPAMQASLDKITQLQSWLNYSAVKKRFIDSKELLLSPELADTVTGPRKDSILAAAKEFVELYENIKLQQSKYQSLYDSLQQVYVSVERKVKRFQQLVNGNLQDPDNIRQLEKIIDTSGIRDKRFKKLSSTLSSIRTLSIGKTMPNFSNLTLKNTNVKGVNFEYNKNNLYLALAAGNIDFRVRDFVYSNQQRVPQFVYAGRIGYGIKERSNIILTYFEGKKQLYARVSNTQSQYIKGVSIAAQLLLNSNNKLNVELAQSAAPVLVGSSSNVEKPAFNFKDKNNQAYSVQIKSYLPRTRTRFEALYQHSGYNFQNFTNYRVNAAANSWLLRAEQYIWKRNLHLVAALRKNDFSNPLVLQRYNANTVFKNFSATFRKKNWPALSLGYMPSSQYTIIDSLIYENHYQILNASVSHQYKLGEVAASSALMYNRFYNNSQDTGFLYYNANNFFFNQVIQFALYTSNISISHTENGSYTLDVWDAGFLFKVMKQTSVGFGLKLNHMDNGAEVKVGMYSNARLAIPKLGELNIWLEKSYLPDMHHTLTKNEFYNIGFTRYFK